MRGCLGRLLVAVALGAFLTLAWVALPLLGLGRLVGALFVPVSVCLFVFVVGKLLYDTLFYDHYWP